VSFHRLYCPYVSRLAKRVSVRTILDVAASKGRPPKAADKVLGARMELHITASERKAYDTAAQKAGLSVSGWIRKILSKATARSGK
jgi:predicted HicB family RNase H-like nuclease